MSASRRRMMVRGIALVVIVVVAFWGVYRFADRNKIALMVPPSEYNRDLPVATTQMINSGAKLPPTWDNFAKLRKLREATVVENDKEMVAEARTMHELLAGGDFEALEQWRTSVGFQRRTDNWWGETLRFRARKFASIKLDWSLAKTYLIRDEKGVLYRATKNIPEISQQLDIAREKYSPEDKMTFPDKFGATVVEVPCELPAADQGSGKAIMKFYLGDFLREKPWTLIRLSIQANNVDKLEEYIPLIK